MHLSAELIIRIGNSCLSKNKQLPVYFLFENKKIEKNKFIEKIDEIKNEYKDKNFLLFYDCIHTESIYNIKETIQNNNLQISQIPYSPTDYQNFNENEDLLIYSKIKIYKKIYL